MEIDSNVQELLNKVYSEKMHSLVSSLEGTDFGLYLPLYVEKNVVKLMLDGYSQTEKNLVVSVSPHDDSAPSDALPVAWMGGQIDKDSECSHGDKKKCKHCTTHTGSCRHCTHKTNKTLSELDAPELDYTSAIEKLKDKTELLDTLAKEEYGLTLLHAHNDKFMFTKLPEGYISVIANGITTFRKESDVEQDSTFVPNIWRSVNGQWRIAGGYSAKPIE